VRPELVPFILEFDRMALKQLQRLSSENEMRVMAALDQLAATGQGDLKDVGSE
jgi:hypothetical protein